jgi:hypothetical protein
VGQALLSVATLWYVFAAMSAVYVKFITIMLASAGALVCLVVLFSFFRLTLAF